VRHILIEVVNHRVSQPEYILFIVKESLEVTYELLLPTAMITKVRERLSKFIFGDRDRTMITPYWTTIPPAVLGFD